MAKPLIKWVGGKRQLLEDIKLNLPENYNKYFEPFIGGGALFFELMPKKAIINDYNGELVNLYETVRDNKFELIDSLANHLNTEEYFYEIRALDRNENYQNLPSVDRASRFIYLNKTCFNGLYRVNRNGFYNVPFGKRTSPKILDSKTIFECSEALKNTEILNGDFEIIKEKIGKGDFIYFDPPYVPLNSTSSFTSYTDQGFDLEMQVRLKEFCDYIDSKGAYFLLSNSDTDFIKELYSDYKISFVQASRSLNCKANGRGKISEVLVKNY